ncbi:restriction endonuclease subunit S [Elizabethkingia anophelis]|uniref:Type I restriction modification DNA specificity domain-containing protein n=1 Tax=Elizabethkingia anophelis TaxID=1117645 RepID=A0AAU8VD83_9FLAO|nr:restriction endonuclease subunit S [Elizabethkingia anophelis]AQX02178.1 hypothetical protein BBD32_12225 [Elizabethkingia anophelis]MYY49252.1 hypothetical protein [Elizabethkingia anophelis]OPB63930.1 hypothetical protein BAY11_16320 [Elizabethkingia anophelis]
MKVLPKNWTKISLENLFNLVYGKGISTKDLIDNANNKEVLYNVYGANGIIGKYNKYTYKNSKVIISCRGAASGTIHKTLPFSFISSNSIVLDEIDEKLINLNFIKYVMTYIDKSEVITGTAQPQITIQLLKFLEIPLPPLQEQKRIAAKLDALFAQHEAMKKALEDIPQLLKNFRQQVLTLAIMGKLTEEWRKTKVLKNWRKTTLKELIVKIDAGKSFECPNIAVSEGQVGLVKISAVTWGFFNENETKTVFDPNRVNEKIFIKSGDFLISRANTLELVGAPVIVESINHKIMLSDKIWRVNFVNSILKKFIKIYLLSKKGRSEIEMRSSGNQLSMRNISQENFKSIPINLPSDDEQQEIVSRVESLFVKADIIEKRYQILKEKIDSLPQAILHKAFKGELVPQLPTDGDAKDLLEEILKLKKEVKKK